MTFAEMDEEKGEGSRGKRRELGVETTHPRDERVQDSLSAARPLISIGGRLPSRFMRNADRSAGGLLIRDDLKIGGRSGSAECVKVFVRARLSQTISNFE